MFPRNRARSFALVALALAALAYVVTGCGRKGPLYLPPDDGKRAAEQTSTPDAK